MSADITVRDGGKPLVIGLTGPIGSGKSHVRSVLVSLGAEGIDADRVAHDVMTPEGPAYPGIVAEFGSDVLGSDGLVDRGKLARGSSATPPPWPGWRRSRIPRSARRSGIGSRLRPRPWS